MNAVTQKLLDLLPYEPMDYRLVFRHQGEIHAIGRRLAWLQKKGYVKIFFTDEGFRKVCRISPIREKGMEEARV